MRVYTSRFTILLADTSGVGPATFKSLYPIHVFDVSKQSDRLTEGVVDLTIRMEFSANVPRIRKPMLSLPGIECLNLKAMDER